MQHSRRKQLAVAPTPEWTADPESHAALPPGPWLRLGEHAVEAWGESPPRQDARTEYLTHRLDEQEKQLRALVRQVEYLRHELSVWAPAEQAADESFVANPFERWLRDPSIERYRGQHVAIHPTQGIVAHADSARTVIAELKAKGIALEDVALDVIPLEGFQA